MTELCSQLYARGTGAHHPPPWLRTLVCDPSTGREQAAGRPGLLRYVDLAVNADSRQIKQFDARATRKRWARKASSGP